MNKKLVEVHFNENINESSIIVFKNNKWIALDKNAFLDDVHKQIKELCDKLNEEIDAREEHETQVANAMNGIVNDIKYLKGEEDNEEE